jgi:Flp pilus assembly pilin Flp
MALRRCAQFPPREDILQRIDPGLRTLVVSENGATAVEYAVILSLIAGVVIAGLAILNRGMQSEFSRTTSGFQRSTTTTSTAGPSASTNRGPALVNSQLHSSSLTAREMFAFSGRNWEFANGCLTAGPYGAGPSPSRGAGRPARLGRRADALS